jgi:hypothetical protein
MNPEEIDAAMEALQMLRAEAMTAQAQGGLPQSGAVAAGDARALGLSDNLGVQRAHEGVAHGKPENVPSLNPAAKFHDIERREGGTMPPEQRMNDGTAVEEDERSLRPNNFTR